MLHKTVQCRELGLMAYTEAWDLQEALFAETIATKVQNRITGTEHPTTNHLLFVAHPHVYTLGKSGDQQPLLIDQEKLAEIGAEFHKINRGGDITYHGPGQIVGYPILDLENFFTDIHKYLRLLEEMIILTLADYGIKS